EQSATPILDRRVVFPEPETPQVEPNPEEGESSLVSELFGEEQYLAYIQPCLTFVGKSAADSAQVDDWLFGSLFADELKAAQACEKAGPEVVKLQGPCTTQTIIGSPDKGDAVSEPQLLPPFQIQDAVAPIDHVRTAGRLAHFLHSGEELFMNSRPYLLAYP
ncbi:hypothetical protein DMN91_010541, partial [Ooceraea biroi]